MDGCVNLPVEDNRKESPGSRGFSFHFIVIIGILSALAAAFKNCTGRISSNSAYLQPGISGICNGRISDLELNHWGSLPA